MSPLFVILLVFVGSFIFTLALSLIATYVESTGVAVVLILALLWVTLYGISLIPSGR